MYEVALERIKQLNQEVRLLGEILRSYLPIIEKEDNEKR
jgi:dipeptidase